MLMLKHNTKEDTVIMSGCVAGGQAGEAEEQGLQAQPRAGGRVRRGHGSPLRGGAGRHRRLRGHGRRTRHRLPHRPQGRGITIYPSIPT